MIHNANNCLQLPEDGQKWGFLIWLLFSYCGLLCIACMSLGKVVVFCCYSSHYMFWFVVFVCKISLFCLFYFYSSEQPINRKCLKNTILLHCFEFRLLTVLIVVCWIICSGWHEDKHIYCVLNRVSLYLNMGYVFPLLSICYYVSYACCGYSCLAPNMSVSTQSLNNLGKFLCFSSLQGKWVR